MANDRLGDKPESTMSESTKPPAFFYGWVIVGVSVMTVIITNGLTIGGIPVFYRSLIDEYQWSRTVIATAGALTLLGAGILVPVVGIYLDRFGVKPFLVAGACVLGGTLFLYSGVAHPLHLYSMHALFALSLSMAGVVTNILLVSNWFIRRRGTAVGAVITGTSLGGVIFPPVSTWLISHLGWRTAMAALSGLVWFVLLPLVLLLVKGHPKEKGLYPDGIPPEQQPRARESQSEQPGLAFAEAVTTGTFWGLVCGAAFSFYVIFSISQQLILHLQSPQVGLTRSQAALGQSALFLFSLVGKFCFGYMSDRWPKKLVTLLCCTTMCLGSLLLLDLDRVTLYPFSLLFGLGFGGTYVMIQLMVIECFGLRSLGKLLGIVTFAETIGAAGGNIITGNLFDRTGSYDLSFRIIIVCAFLALLLLAALKPHAQSRVQPSVVAEQVP